MTLPGADAAHIDPRKVRDYLLSHAHRVGRLKAPVFEHLGYRRADWRVLHEDLQRAAMSDGAASVRMTAYGRLYRLAIMLEGPSGRVGSFVTIWIIRTGEHYPRFVTAFPGE